MKSNLEPFTVEALLDSKHSHRLFANSEYQRAAVWSEDQERRLVDSLLRGYTLPLIYVHKIAEKTLVGESLRFEVIDGQQRLNALYRYRQGEFALFDPKKDAAKARFPKFVQDAECSWGGKRFDELPEEVAQSFLCCELMVAIVETDFPGEARDLFVRLQAGTPLDAQEKRDASPGNMNEFIRKYAGKLRKENDEQSFKGYSGHDFYKTVMKVKPNDSRVRYRTFTGQWLLLLLGRWERKGDWFGDVNSKAVDDLYYEYIDFDLKGNEAGRFVKILDTIEAIFKPHKFVPLRGHEAMHLILLVDSLMDGYAPNWYDELFPAYEEFSKLYALSKKNQDAGDPYWTNYAIPARTGSDSGRNIRTRHEFFSKEMRTLMPGLKMKDPDRLFGLLDKEIVYATAKKVCAVCQTKVDWSDAEFHHVVEHHEGGKTSLDNCALVHKACHPKSESAVKSFEANWKANKSGGNDAS